MPGYPLHCLGQDGAKGGHVLGFEPVTGTAQVDGLGRVGVRLPLTADFADANLAADRQGELKRVEKGTGPR